MHVFVTGATGFVGSAVVDELLVGGHRVTGLARSDASAAALAAKGVAVRRGALEDHASLRAGASAADAVVHLAFNHDFANFAANGAVEAAAVEAIGGALLGTDKPFLVTSGVALLAPGRVSVESDVSPNADAFPRKSEVAAAALAARGVRTCVIRLAPSVHGEGDIGFVPIVIGIARANGHVTVIDGGTNRWPAVHRLDAARLYRLAVEAGGVGGPFHGVAEEGVALHAIAEVIGRRLNVPIVSKSREAAAADFGWFTMFAGANVPASSAHTQAVLGWTPTHPGLLTDLDAPFYFGG